MSYDAPTLAEFRARFPIFTQHPDPQIEMILEEATNTIDTSWRELDYKIAIMYLTAHLLAVDASQSGDEVAVGSAGSSSGVVSSESFGGMSISYATNSALQVAASKSTWGETEYGRRFYQLLVRNKPAIVSI
jgi:hypothetical protein